MRGLKATEWEKTKVDVVNQDTGITIEADVLSRSADRLVLAIRQVKVILTKNKSGAYVGKMLGMNLKSDG